MRLGVLIFLGLASTNSEYCSWLVFIVIYLVVLYRRAVSEKEEKRGKRGRREAGNGAAPQG